MLAPVDRLDVSAPLAGFMAPLYTVLNPVFAQKIGSSATARRLTLGHATCPLLCPARSCSCTVRTLH